ncbi:MAG: endonuclease III domain-containing protein [Nanoarchaeota archaeon]|nr:endonuclease III domain-containing protein [Nanoarchaeota archaeon]
MSETKNRMINIYKQLLKKHKPQGWWPLLNCKGTNPTKTGSIKGYHTKDYSYPHNEQEKFEIIIGAILTQNTAWPNVEKALLNLKKLKAINPKKLLKLTDKKLKEAIKPAGYFNQKANYLKNITELFIKLKGKTPTREELLKIKGVGNETADSILLYAYKQPEFVVDAYTKRLLKLEDKKYEEVKELFEKNLPKKYELYQEYHALIVEEGKRKVNKVIKKQTLKR